MTTAVNNVLLKKSRLTQSLTRQLIANAVRTVQAEHGLTDTDLADILGCSAGTIKNARNGDGQMQPHTLFSLMDVKPTALDGLLHHFDRRSVPIAAKCDTDALPSTAAAVHKLAVVTAEGSPGGKAITDGECLDIESEIDAALDSLHDLKARCHNIRAARAA